MYTYAYVHVNIYINIYIFIYVVHSVCGGGATCAMPERLTCMSLPKKTWISVHKNTSNVE